jgi:Mg-chelatase subunit ChlD
MPLPGYGTIDICFCIDATGSMGSYLDQAKSTVLSIINKI